jgi:hypothetical protein
MVETLENLAVADGDTCEDGAHRSRRDSRKLRRRWRVQPSGKRRKPFAHCQRSIVRNQVGPRIASLCCRNGRHRRVLNV